MKAIDDRWTRKTSRTKTGKRREVIVTERDVEIFKLLARYPYLPSDFLRAFVGGGQQGFVRRLQELTDIPACFILRPEASKQTKRARSRPLVYSLDKNGVKHLEELHIHKENNIPHPTNFAHDFLSCLVMASIELGIRSDQNAKLISWSEILASPQLPEATKKSSAPTFMPTVVDGLPTNIKADWTPFAIKTASDFLFFGGFEMDRGHEVLRSQNKDRERIEAKFRGYLHFLEKQTYRSHFGASSFYIPFVFTQETRMHSAIKILSDLKPGQHARRFLFKFISDFYVDAPLMPPTGHMYSEPWLRADYPPFFIQDPNKEKVAA